MNGNVTYWLYMGKSLFYGREGAIKNQTEARRWFEKAAGAGSEEATEILKKHYHSDTTKEKGATGLMARKKKSSKEENVLQSSAANSLFEWLETEAIHHKEAKPLSMEKELQLCRGYAEHGYQLAQENYVKVQNDLVDIKSRLKEANQEQRALSRIGNEKIISEQSREMKHLEASMLKIQDNIEHLHKCQKEFSIVIYGRTTVGKSTLMEILTHGDGKSIGKGEQRTTRDVRDYYWQGLKITDIPGRCSFGGGEDDRLAIEAAKSADLVVFLLTDDSPQPSEAESLADLRRLGKPVLGIVNVRQALRPLTDTKHRKVDLKALAKKINNQENLDAIVRQFCEFAKIYEQDFRDIPFVYTNLQAAFLSQKERENDTELYKLSRFAEVEKFILEKVRKDGKFIRIKTFVDSVARPMQNAIAHIFRYSAETMKTAALFDEKLEQLDKWRDYYANSSRDRCDTFIDGINSQINRQISAFVEKHYEDYEAGKEWEICIKNMHVDRKCEKFIRDLGSEAADKMHELSDELTTDLKYIFKLQVDTSISMDSITDYRKWLRAATTLSIIFGPVGWGWGFASELFGLLFLDSEEDKQRKQKAKLRELLEKNRDKMIDKIRNEMLKVIKEQILGEQINGFRGTLETMRQMLTGLTYGQSSSAGKINERYRELNLTLLRVAEKYVNVSLNINKFQIARVVGQEVLLFSREAVPKETRGTLSAILGEQIVSAIIPSEMRKDRIRALEEEVLHIKCKCEKPWKEERPDFTVLATPAGTVLFEGQRQLAQQMMGMLVV